MVVLKANSCRICRRVFCCLDCRNAHESNKHPQVKCSLCLQKTFPFKSFQSEDTRKYSSLIDHIVLNHLPLYCKFCGDRYTKDQDLLTAKPCRWWTKASQSHSLRPLGSAGYSSPRNVATVHPSNVNSTSIVIGNSSLELTNPVEREVPSTPGSRHKSFVDASAISRVKEDPKNFDSPPELSRQTSTPVYGSGPAKQHQKQVNPAAIPQFVLKTPSSSLDKGTPTFNGTGSSSISAISRTGSTSSTGFESRYYTGLTSGLVCGPSDELGSPDEIKDHSENSPTYSILKKDNKKGQIDKDFEVKFDPLGRISCINESSRDNSEKRVRFSDQCDFPSSRSDQPIMQKTALTDTSAYSTDSDIFFEARETLDDENNINGTDDERSKEAKTEREKSNINMEKIEREPCTCRCRERITSDDKQCSPSSSTDVYDSAKDTEEVKRSTFADNSTGESKLNTSTSSTTSSRVLMMLLVEKSDAKGLTSLDLAPLIDSGLKKLEATRANANNVSNTDKGSHECIAEVSSFTRRRSFNEETTEKGFDRNGGLRASKGSFMSISDEVECYHVAAKQSQKTINDESKQKQQQQHLANKADSTGAVEPYKLDGIFSVVARVVRSAFKKLPAVGSGTSRNLSREPEPTSSPCVSFTAASTSSFSAVSTPDLPSASSVPSASSTLALPTQRVLRSASKRPRELLDSGEEQPQSTAQQHSPGSSTANEVVSSPVAKRPRGWYRIRAREPIARMRERQIPVSPRGASRETQLFHQGSGSLTIANSDTHLPLPSRAHQATQTDGKPTEH